VRIVWRGGRPFKTPQEISEAPKKANGTEPAVISLDSDDDDTPSKDFEDKAEFEDDEEEFEPFRPYPSVLQVLDLHFGTDVFHLALLPSAVLKADSSSWQGIDLLKQKIIFTAACADNSIRLVTLPLTPPSPISKARPDFRSNFTLANPGNGKWGETVIQLAGHKTPSDGLAMTAYLVNNPDVKSESKSSDVHAMATNLSHKTSDTRGIPQSKPPTTPEAHIIVASHSREVTGLLLLWRVSTKSPKPQVEPYQTCSLSSPAKSISFNPSLSAQRSSHLLVAESTGVCRIYDFKLLSNRAEEPSENPVFEQGSWLLSLYPGFQVSKSESQAVEQACFGRKPTVDAQWVSGGKAILVLVNDGEFGIWDIEGVGPGASQGLLGRQDVKGGSLTQFSLTGYLETGAKPRTSGPPQISSSRGFAPMTPGTRKSTTPFGEREANGPVRGQISVIEVPSTSPTNPSEESVVFWLGDTFALIPSLAKYWAASRGKPSGTGNLFTSTTVSGNRIMKLEGIDLKGERCTSIEQIPKMASSSSVGALPTDVLILGEHRFTILAAGKPVKGDAATGAGRLAMVDKTTNSNTNGGELDVVGIDRALARMENGHSKKLLGR
jgi:hypothetical protein